jgi:hypothetical protein
MSGTDFVNIHEKVLMSKAQTVSEERQYFIRPDGVFEERSAFEISSRSIEKNFDSDVSRIYLTSCEIGIPKNPTLGKFFVLMQEKISTFFEREYVLKRNITALADVRELLLRFDACVLLYGENICSCSGTDIQANFVGMNLIQGIFRASRSEFFDINERNREFLREGGCPFYSDTALVLE